MTELVFDCLDARPERYAAAPTMILKLRIAELTGEPIHAMTLQCQIRIEAQRRRYADAEAERLHDLFGETARWGDTLKPLHFISLALTVPAFSGSVEVELPVPCTYDFEVTSAKYLNALDEGEIPLILLFSGSVFTRGASGFAVERVPWNKEAQYRLPVATWRAMMDLHFPDGAWIRVRRDTFDALQRYKSRQALTGWDEALESLLGVKGEAS
jgi:hypothetical protein